MLREVKNNDGHYFINEQNRKHGEYKLFYSNASCCVHTFFVNGIKHGEYRHWGLNGNLTTHCFFVNGNQVSFNELPYPETEEEKMYFKLKYDIPLISYRPNGLTYVKRN